MWSPAPAVALPGKQCMRRCLPAQARRRAPHAAAPRPVASPACHLHAAWNVLKANRPCSCGAQRTDHQKPSIVSHLQGSSPVTLSGASIPCAQTRGPLSMASLASESAHCFSHCAETHLVKQTHQRSLHHSTATQTRIPSSPLGSRDHRAPCALQALLTRGMDFTGSHVLASRGGKIDAG